MAWFKREIPIDLIRFSYLNDYTNQADQFKEEIT